MTTKDATQPQATNAPQAFTRVYMDITAENHLAAKMAALQAGMTLKAWMESLITQALAPAKKGKGKK